MTWLKRIFFFVLVNVLVITTISIVLNILGVQPYINEAGLDYNALMMFCLVWGMGGAFISLALSRIMAKWMMGVKIIPANTHDERLADLVQTVHQMARSAGIQVMPEVGIFDSDAPNAFATGPTKNRSLVAVSSGLLRRMDRQSVHGVLGHEVAHIANGDMVTMTLIQGIINAFVMFFARIAAFAISQALRGKDDDRVSPFLHGMLVFVFEIAFSALGFIVVAGFSRWREFRADSGGAKLAGRESMISALQALRLASNPGEVPPALQSMQISGKSGGFAHLFSTHPPLEDRIRALGGSPA